MVNLPQDYFRPLNQLIHGNYKEIKCDPITALVMASYLTLIVPAAFLMLNCLKGRINREASEKAKKVNEAALKAMEEEKARKLISDGDAYMGNHDYFKAFECYKKAAELNSSEGHHSLGYCYDTGKGINQDYALAIKHYLLSQDQYESCYNLGYLYENGLGCEKSYEKAAEFYEKAMKMGDKEARLALANLYELGLGVEKDEKKAFDLVDPIANFMYPEADVRLGRYYYDGIGCKADYSQALNIFRYHAKHPDACYYHGLMHLEGRGVQKDEKMAFELFNKAKALGCVQASLRLARMYYEGIGIEPNPEMAFKVISDAHHESNYETNIYLGLFYLRGVGVDKDLKKARSHLEAAKRQEPDSSNELLEELELRELLEREEDPENLFKKGKFLVEKGDINQLALDYFKKGANMGHIRSQYYAGLLSEEELEAKAYFELAANQGDAASLCELGKLEEDDKKAFEWFRRAAEKQDLEGYYLLGKSLVEGQGCKQDAKTGLKYIQYAAEQGYPSALSFLSLKYYKGSPETPRDDKKAFDLMTRAYQKDSTDYHSLYWLGVFHMRGVGTKVDTQKARALFDEGKELHPKLDWEHFKKELPLWEALEKEEDPKSLYEAGRKALATNHELGYAYLIKASAKGHEEARDTLQKSLFT